MARSGISKILVQKARDTLIGRGENPSIDAVRVELGNTGSKSTIHRYLRELAQEEGARLDDEQLLGATIGSTVAQLARQLREEASAIVEAAETRHAAESGAQRAEIDRLNGALAQIQAQAVRLDAALEEERGAHAATREALQGERVRTGATATENEALKLRLAEHMRQIESLEEKHRHARDSLEHYRQSVKDQRDLDQRRHEGQVQLLQAELRQHAQTLAAKQDEATRIGQDCARLAAELAETRRALREAQQQQREDQRARDDLIAVHARLEAAHAAQAERLSAAETAREAFAAERDALRQQLAEREALEQRLEARLAAQESLYGELQRRLDGLGPVASPGSGNG